MPIAADGESRIYEDIDRNSLDSCAAHEADAGDAAVDSGFSSVRRGVGVGVGVGVVVGGGRTPAISSDDSWGSGEFESFSSDGDDDDQPGKSISPA